MTRKMKDSGIEWIGEIPEGWEIKYFVQLFTQVKNKNIGLLEKNLLSLSYGKIKKKSIETVGGLLPANFEGYNIIEKGDIVLRLTDLQNDQRSLRVGLSNERGIVTSAYCSIRVRGNQSPSYLYYYLYTFDIVKGFYGMGSGVRQGLNWDGLKYIRVVLPPQLEQNRISTFLDKKTFEIDSILSTTISSIEEYKKLKQAVITQTVTKGVRGEREMKDSGIEWIGEIPEEWNTAKAKYCVEITHGCDPKTDGTIPVYGSGAESFKTCGESKEGPAVLIGRKGATLHIPHYIEGKYWNVDTAFDVKAKSNFRLRYYYYLATSFDYKFYISQTTLPGMTQGNYYNMLLPLPTLFEQQEIVNYLDAKCAEIDRLIAKKEQLVKELESYKKSLIYEVVTGKREV